MNSSHPCSYHPFFFLGHLRASLCFSLHHSVSCICLLLHGKGASELPCFHPFLHPPVSFFPEPWQAQEIFPACIPPPSRVSLTNFVRTRTVNIPPHLLSSHRPNFKPLMVVGDSVTILGGWLLGMCRRGYEVMATWDLVSRLLSGEP